MFLKKNLSVLEKRNPNLTNAIKNAHITGRYKMSPSQRSDGTLNLLDMKTNKSYYNFIDPLISAEKDLENRKINLGNLALFLGFGAGYQILIYMKKYPQAQVVAVECDAELLHVVFTYVDLSELLTQPNFVLLGAVEPINLYPELFNFFNRNANLAYLKSLNVIDMLPALAAYQNYYITIIKTVKEAIAGVITLYGNDPYDSLLGIKYTLRNLSIIINNPGIKDLEGIFKGKPGIVVATGPSLNKNVHLLENIYNKAVIIGVDASVKVLKKYGLKPAHMVTSLERVEETSKLFEGLTIDDTQDSFLSACPVVVPQTYANFPGEKIIVYRNFATFKWLDIPKGILDIGPSSANMAFKILEFLGCNPIILIGQDLAYGEDLSSHAEGFHYGSKADTKHIDKSFLIPGNFVEKIATSTAWYQFLKHYERDIAAYEGTVINATEGGAKIHGTTLMTLQEVIEKYIKDDINPIATIRKNLKYTSEKVKRNEVNEVLKKLYHALNYSLNITEKCKNGIDLCNQYGLILQESNHQPDEATLEKLNHMLDNIFKVMETFNETDFYLILMHYVQSFFIKSCMDINALRFANPPSLALNADLAIKLRELFSVMIALIEKIIEEFNVSIKLLEEFKEKINS